MNVEESSGQLLRKIQTLSLDLDGLASKTISKLCHQIQNLIPSFIVPGTLGPNDTEPALPNRKRKTRATRSTAKSSTCNTRSKRRKLTASASSIDASEHVQSFALSDVEMQTVPEGRSSTSVTPKLDLVCPGRTNASQSIPEVKPIQIDAMEDDTLVAENTVEDTQSVRHTQNSFKETNTIGLKLEPPDPPKSKRRKSSVRVSSEAKNHSLASIERNCVGSSGGEDERLSSVVTEGGSRRSSSRKTKISTSFVRPSATLVSQTAADRSISVSANEDGNNEDALRGSYRHSSIMTEESDDSVDMVEAQASKSSAQPSKASPFMIAAAVDVTTSIPTSTNAVSVTSASQTSSTPAVSSYAESRLRHKRNTPRPPGLSKPWLSRLGWGTAAKTPSTNATNIMTVATMTNSNLSHQAQASRLSAKASVGMGKLKSAIIPNASSVTKHAKPAQAVANLAPRLPTTSQFNKAPGTSKANLQVNDEKEFSTAYRSCASMAAGALSRKTATGLLQAQSALKLLPKNVAEDDRRARVMAKIAESEQRHQELMERRAMEHKAKMKAANEHRMAVRANAEREAKEKQAATTRKMEAERLKLQKIVIKTKMPPSKTTIAANQQRSSQLVKHLPLSSAPTNTAAATSTTAASSSANYMKNFDLAKVAPPPPAIPSHSTTANNSQPPPPPSAPPTSPLSYDLSGLLSDYDSDSDNEKRHRRRVIPSWAKYGSADLVFWVSRVYRGDVTWKDVFRPAEDVHFEDTELFHGYKFRTRPRGSSAAWDSPSPPPNSSHPKTPS